MRETFYAGAAHKAARPRATSFGSGLPKMANRYSPQSLPERRLCIDHVLLHNYQDRLCTSSTLAFFWNRVYVETCIKEKNSIKKWQNYFFFR
jgi:hypothetical protein